LCILGICIGDDTIIRIFILGRYDIEEIILG
jgi:hypothetical protein